MNLRVKFIKSHKMILFYQFLISLLIFTGIEYLHNTLERVISLLSSFTGVEDNKENSMKQLVALLNKDTLKTMQLLGFSYKEAIGEPLTEVCSNAIREKLGGKTKGKISKIKNHLNSGVNFWGKLYLECVINSQTL